MECCGKEDFSMELDCLTMGVSRIYFDFFFFYVNYVDIAIGLLIFWKYCDFYIFLTR